MFLIYNSESQASHLDLNFLCYCNLSALTFHRQAVQHLGRKLHLDELARCLHLMNDLQFDLYMETKGWRQFALKFHRYTLKHLGRRMQEEALTADTR